LSSGIFSHFFTHFLLIPIIFLPGRAGPKILGMSRYVVC
jgi:hypothetical protein